jgi:hypothetical protein
MKISRFAAGILAFALVGTVSAQGIASPAKSGTHYTQAELKKMARDARTPVQYNALASYYGDQKQFYSQQAAAEKQEWERRSQNVMAIAAKYPRPVDSARNLYEYYAFKASEAGTLEAKYQQLGVQGSVPANQ